MSYNFLILEEDMSMFLIPCRASKVTKAFNPIPIGYDNIVSILFLGYLQLSCSDYFSLEKITCYNTLGLFVNDVAPIVIIVKVSSTFWLLKLGMHSFSCM